MSESQEITLTAWTNSTSDKPNGFKISKGTRNRLFKPLKSRLDQEGVIMEFPAGESPRLSVKVTPSFWRNCHEFRSHKIGAWIKDQGDAPWPEGERPKYIAELSTAGTGPIKIKVLRKKKT